MSAANYSRCLALTLKHEGGFADHPKDPGGATMKGVTQAVYNAFRKRQGKSVQTVRLIEDAELQAIYRKQYWDAVRGDDLPAGVDFAVFDFAVNSGPQRAAKALQIIVGLTPDGAIGERTLEAVGAAARRPLIETYCSRRLTFLQKLKTWPTFGKGWARRVDDVRKQALAMAAGAAPPAPTHRDAPDWEPAPPKAQPAPAPEGGSILDKIGSIGAAIGGVVASLIGAVSSPWGLAALVVITLVAGFAAWRLWPRKTMPELGP